MKTKTLILTILALVAVIFVITKFSSKPDTDQVNNSNNGTQIEYIGEVSTSTDGFMLYKNEKLSLSFKYPQGWYLGSNSLGYGSLQLLNYDITKASGKSIFPEGTNKIEAFITDQNSVASSLESTEQSRKTNNLQINGQSVTREDITLAGGMRFNTYIIPIPSLTEKYLAITIYGDPKNFSILDDLVKSIEWNNY